MKSTAKHFILAPSEYLVTTDSPDAKEYTVYYKGRMLRCIQGIIINASMEKIMDAEYARLNMPLKRLVKNIVADR